MKPSDYKGEMPWIFGLRKRRKGYAMPLSSLRSRKPLEKITIKELCEHAYINKSTFYSHYKDIYDLSERMEEEVVSSITNSISHPEYIMENPAEFTRELFLAYLSQNSLITILFPEARGIISRTGLRPASRK